MVDGGTGRARARRHAICKWRFDHRRQIGAGLAARLAARRHRARSQRAPYDDDRTGISAVRRIRSHAFSPRLLPFFADVAAVDAFRHDASWAPRPARAPPGFRDILRHSRRFNFECATPTDPKGQLGRDSAPWIACRRVAAAADPTLLSRLPRTDISREGRGPRDPYLTAVRNPSKDRRQGGSRGRRLFRRDDTPAAFYPWRGVHRRDRRCAEVRILERRDRSTAADRLAGTVRTGHDRSYGLRRSGCGLQSRFRFRNRRRRGYGLCGGRRNERCWRGW